MDRSARTAGVARRLSDAEVLQRAGVEADLPGILRAYGWRAVRGEDARERRVLTDADETRRIVVTRHPEDGHWQWWDTAVRIVGNIVDAIRQLVGFQLLREIIGLLRHALDDPPGPLPVLETEQLDAASERIGSVAATDQSRSDDESSDEQSPQVMELDEADVSLSSDEFTEIEDTGPTETEGAADDKPAEVQDSPVVETPEAAPDRPPRMGRRRR